VDLGQPIPMSFIGRLAENPEIDPTTIEPFIESFGRWKNPAGGTELCIILGSQLEDGASGAIRALTPQLRESLTEPNSIAIDKGELERLGLKTGVRETDDISG